MVHRQIQRFGMPRKEETQKRHRQEDIQNRLPHGQSPEVIDEQSGSQTQSADRDLPEEESTM